MLVIFIALIISINGLLKNYKLNHLNCSRSDAIERKEMKPKLTAGNVYNKSPFLNYYCLTLNRPAGGGEGQNPPTGWFFPLLC